MKLIAMKQVIEKTGVCKTAIHNMVAVGLFPKPIKLQNQRRARWLESEVDTIIRAWVSGKSEDQTRVIVDTIERERKTL